MFETSRRRHPLHSFRFWFLIFGAVTLTIAWKFNLLPFSVGPAETGSLAEQTFTEVDQSSAAPEQGEEPDLTLPFSEGDESLALPTIAPADTPLRTAAVEPTDGPPPQTELTFSDGGAPATTSNPVTDGPPSSVTSTFDEWDDDWPTQQPPRREPASSPSSAIVQTSATRMSPSSEFDFATEPFAVDDEIDASDANPSGIDFSKIDGLLATGVPADEIEAHRLLSTIYWQQPEARTALRRRIDTLAQNIYFLNGRHYMEAYEVQPGDTLQNIARQYDVPWQYLAKLNRVDPRKVRTGQRLKVIKGPFSAIVDLSEFELTIHAHGYFVTRFSVGIGKDGSSPIGKFAVQEKLVDPTYYGPDGVVDHDDPTNPLGERWIDLGNSYGIHGTIDPASIGKSESRGCIRLHNDDVAAVYDLLTIGSEVTIRP